MSPQSILRERGGSVPSSKYSLIVGLGWRNLVGQLRFEFVKTQMPLLYDSGFGTVVCVETVEEKI